jgi:hypothetical protein
MVGETLATTCRNTSGIRAGSWLETWAATIGTGASRAAAAATATTAAAGADLGTRTRSCD